jgi:putative secretion ATPase (PEP-CTERM system associated)
MYNQHFGIEESPFSIAPDPRYLYMSDGHREAFAHLLYGIQGNSGFVLLTGEVGTGKTTLARLMLSKINRSKVIAVELVTSQLESDDMLRLVAAALGLAHQDLPKSTLLRNIETYLMARAREGKRVLLLVDEVQNLSRGAMEELRMLSNFQVGEKALLQTFLLGQSEFRPKMQSAGMEQFRQRIIASYHLDPLNRKEIQDYIFHRLRLCGWQDDPHIQSDVFERIYEHTSGVPRRINKLCDRLLLHGCIEELHELCVKDINAVIRDEMQEMHATGEISNGALPVQEEVKPAGVQVDNVQPLRVENAISNDDRRLLSLEKKVEMLEKSIRNDRKRFQRMLMMLALSDDDDKELLEMLKELDAADK